MIIHVNIETNSDRVRINIPQAEMSIEIPNLIAYDLHTGELVSIGETAGELREKSTGETRKSAGTQIGFLAPFDVEHFDPDFAATIISYYVNIACSKTRPGLWKMWSFDQLQYKIQLSGYEKLAPQVCIDFEHLLIQLLRANGSSSINGRRIRQLYWKHSLPDLLLVTMLALGTTSLLAIYYWFILSIGIDTQPFSLPLLILLTAPMLFVVMLGWLLGLVFWVLIARGFSAKTLMRSRLSMMLPKKLSDWLCKILLSEA